MIVFIIIFIIGMTITPIITLMVESESGPIEMKKWEWLLFFLIFGTFWIFIMSYMLIAYITTLIWFLRDKLTQLFKRFVK